MCWCNLEHVYALCMPALAVLVTVIAACVVLNAISLVYLAVAATLLYYPDGALHLQHSRKLLMKQEPEGVHSQDSVH